MQGGGRGAIAVLHQSGRDLRVAERKKVRTKELWRVKNWIDHPRDPGWDDGRYCDCHPGLRNSRKRGKGETVADCVNDGTRKGYVVRSYFMIEALEPCRLPGGKGQDLLFTCYYFCDGTSPYRLNRRIHRRWGYYLTEKEFAELKQHPSYRRYQVLVGMGPKSIDEEDWLKMVTAKPSRGLHSCT